MIYLLIHIVSPNETIAKIADGYHCLINDIKAINLHITDFSHLAPGTKLKIPFLTKEKIETLEETEPFVSDYYPTYNGYLNGVSKSVVDDKQNIDQDYIEDDDITNPIIIEENLEEAKVELKEAVEKSATQSAKRYPNYYVNYRGNLCPQYNEKYIRKI